MPPKQQRPNPVPVGLPAGRYFGVPVYFSASWFIFAGFITLMWADVVQEHVDGVTTGQSYAVAFLFAVLLAVSVLLHELGHCVVSLVLGLKVKRIVLLLLGGVSEIESEPERPSHEYLIALAGPLVSLFLAGVGAVGFSQLDEGSVERWLVVQLMLCNLGVMIFNMLPGLPLDGGRLLRAAIWQVTRSQMSGTKAAVWGGRIIAVAILVGAAWLMRNDEQLDIATLFFALILAGFIWFNATQTMRVATLRDALPKMRVADLVRSAVEIAADATAGEAVRRARDSKAGAVVLVGRDGRAEALVSEVAIMAIPEQRRPWTPAMQVARTLEPGLLLRDTMAGERLLSVLRETPASEYLVVGRDGGTIGVLVAADVAKHFTGVISGEPE